MNEYRARRSPPSTLSSRKPGESGGHKSEYARTGVSMSASTSRYTGMRAWSAARARDSSRVGVHSLLISSSSRLELPPESPARAGPERERYQSSGVLHPPRPRGGRGGAIQQPLRVLA